MLCYRKIEQYIYLFSTNNCKQCYKLNNEIVIKIALNYFIIIFRLKHSPLRIIAAGTTEDERHQQKTSENASQHTDVRHS